MGWQHIDRRPQPKVVERLDKCNDRLVDRLASRSSSASPASRRICWRDFLNNSFLAFQMIQHYERRNEVGPYHPGIETFTPRRAPRTTSNVFAFINKLWDTRGYTSAVVRINAAGPNAQYALGRDIFKGGLMSLVFRSRTLILTDYIENVTWRITPTSGN
jgi:hypothetical protein